MQGVGVAVIEFVNILTAGGLAEEANSHTVEIDASHAVTVSQPHAVAELIVQAARATTD